MNLRRGLNVLGALLVLSVGGCFAHDMSTTHDRQIATRAVIAVIETYRAHGSPRVGRIVTCRFTPTCSAYGLESVRRLGAYRGSIRALGRIARCNPTTPMGTVDPP